MFDVWEFEPDPTYNVPLETHALFLFGSEPPLIVTLDDLSTAIFPYFAVFKIRSYVWLIEVESFLVFLLIRMFRGTSSYKYSSVIEADLYDDPSPI